MVFTDEEEFNEKLGSVIQGLKKAELFCTGEALPDAVVTLYLLRQKLRSLGDRSRDQAAVVKEVDSIVSLLAPGISVLELWQNNQTESAHLWEALNGLISAMDQHCPCPPCPPSASDQYSKLEAEAAAGEVPPVTE